jgi:hypothetical protein
MTYQPNEKRFDGTGWILAVASLIVAAIAQQALDDSTGVSIIFVAIATVGMLLAPTLGQEKEPSP